MIPSGAPSGPIWTRLAPSPTGALHLGNLRTFAINWALARQRGWRILLRIEDLDGPRITPGASEQMVEMLAWLGFDWDAGPIAQSADPEPYRAAMQALRSAGAAYPSALSRKEAAEAASAPHARTPGAARPPVFGPAHRPPIEAGPFDQPRENHRFAIPADAQHRAWVAFHDEFAGPQRIDVATEAGDVVIWRREGLPAYQLAVVVDDARQGVSAIVRGDDLIPSAACQLLLAHALGLEPEPRYWHLPLVVGPDGRRLAKRHGDTRLHRYRADGTPPERLVGLVAWSCGVVTDRAPMMLTEFAEAFDLARLDPNPYIFTEEDDRWLVAR
ncbi:MAG: glutamate--tRNA ligase family protein [Planctomycetota bacterium]